MQTKCQSEAEIEYINDPIYDGQWSWASNANININTAAKMHD